MKVKGLLERLRDGESVLIAEGYCFELERRGYLKAGHYVPEVVYRHPALVAQVHREYVHAGSDVTQAFTYYVNRRKAKYISDSSVDLESMYKQALTLARDAAKETGTLFAGDICDTTMYNPHDDDAIKAVKDMFKEQVEWISAGGGADYIVLETFAHLGEARLALEAVRTYYRGPGGETTVPTVVTFACKNLQDIGMLLDGVTVEEACRQMELEGANVVGLNCVLGPATMLPLLEKIRATCKGPIAAIPVPYRTNKEFPRFTNLLTLSHGKPAIVGNLEEHFVSRETIRDFTKRAKEIGVQYFGLCCGNMSCYTRAMAETLGRTPAASQYSPDASTHAAFQSDAPKWIQLQKGYIQDDSADNETASS